jgi:HEAT repeat protein
MIKTKLWLTQRQLSSSSPQKRLEAVQKLRAMKDPDAIGALINALEDPEAAVRTEVVSALGEFEDPSVVRALVGALRDHSEPVQELAIQALKKIGDHSVIEPIAGVLLRGTPGVQYHAAQALRALGWAPRTLGEQIPYYVATGDFKRVAMFGTAAVSALAAVLRGGSNERRVAAATTLGEMSDPSVLKPLLAALKDSEPMVRSAVASALARSGNPQVSAALLPLLKDRARGVRVAVVTAIGQLGDTHGVELLTDLANDREWEVRTALAEALGRLGDHRALPTVLNLLRDQDQEVRQSAADALGKVGDESALESLLMGMVDEHMGVRQASARSLAMVEPYWERSERVRAFLPQLQEAVRNRDPGVQVAAAALLRRLTGRSAAEFLASEAKMPSHEGDELTDLLQRLLGDHDEYVRLAAAEALGRLKLPGCIPPLQTALRDQSKWVKQAAERGLEALTSGR